MFIRITKKEVEELGYKRSFDRQELYKLVEYCTPDNRKHPYFKHFTRGNMAEYSYRSMAAYDMIVIDR